MGNGDTQKWVLGMEGPKKQLANEYMQKSNPEPVEYKLVAHLPAGADGHDVGYLVQPVPTQWDEHHAR